MGGIDDHSQFVHLCHHFFAERLESSHMLLRIVAGRIACGIFKVPQESDQSYALVIYFLDSLDLSVEKDAVLYGQK